MTHLNILAELEKFAAETGLSEHRVGIIVAKNGRIFERLRNPNGRGVWPETLVRIERALEAERARRHPQQKEVI